MTPWTTPRTNDSKFVILRKLSRDHALNLPCLVLKTQGSIGLDTEGNPLEALAGAPGRRHPAGGRERGVRLERLHRCRRPAPVERLAERLERLEQGGQQLHARSTARPSARRSEVARSAISGGKSTALALIPMPTTTCSALAPALAISVKMPATLRRFPVSSDQLDVVRPLEPRLAGRTSAARARPPRRPAA